MEKSRYVTFGASSKERCARLTFVEAFDGHQPFDLSRGMCSWRLSAASLFLPFLRSACHPYKHWLDRLRLNGAFAVELQCGVLPLELSARCVRRLLKAGSDW
eukprot:scaffold2262_cov262-Pinguiococcus_pyrenoidosus.AAC.9